MEPETLKPFINRIPALSTLLPLGAADAAFWTETAMFPSCCSCYGIDLRSKINTGNSVGGGEGGKTGHDNLPRAQREKQT